MAKRPFSTRPSYVHHVQGLHRLHELVAADQDDTLEADVIRDSMDDPWYELSEVEKTRISGLSGDLYSISEPAEPVLEMNSQAQQKLVEAMEAREAGEWDKALDLFRRWERYLEPALLSYLRGTVWQDAGDHATAALFFKHASRLQPANETYSGIYLNSLWECDPVSALKDARDILTNDDAYHPHVVTGAAVIQYKSVQDMGRADALAIFHQLVIVLERIFERLQKNENENGSKFEATYMNAASILAFCYSELGDLQAALRYYNLALGADPNDATLLVARGILRYDVEGGAVDDFERASGQRVRIVWPYFYLAHHYLINNRFEECRKMCELALDFPVSEEIRGNLHEWLAISIAELGFPHEQVRSAFEAAVRLAPDTERIRRNFEAFEEFAVQHAWEKPGESQVKAFGQARYQPFAA